VKNSSLALAVADRKTETVINALIQHSKRLPDELYQSLTWDRGKEMADHKRFTLATDIDVYFCDPKSPWQRGSNENTIDFFASISRKELISLFTHRPNLIM